jgi:hypothetical protein
MHARHPSIARGVLRSLLCLVALALTGPAMIASSTSAGSTLTPVSHGAAAQPATKAARPMFGALGKYITTPDAAKPWGPRGRRAYRIDIPLMASMNPIRYRTSFAVPVRLASMRAAGIKLVLTVRNGPWNTDMPLPNDGSADRAFQGTLRTLIDQLHPDYLVYGNEVDVPAKYSGSAAQFQHLMKLGHAVAKAKGVKDGGVAMVGAMAAEATYADIKATRGKAAAKRFQQAAAMGPFHQSLADKANAYIDACRKAGVDYFVWHSYFSNPSAILAVKSYVERRFEGPSFINELGWRTGSANTGLRVLDALNKTDLRMALIYGSGFGPNAPDGLWTTSGSLTPEGKVISKHLSTF